VSIAENLRRVRQAIARSAESVGRDPTTIELVAVSKIHPPEAIREAYDAGQRHFGENYVQELVAKQDTLADLDEIRWHFIGHLQRNKVKHTVGVASLIETVDSERLIAEIEKRARAAGISVDVLLQVNIGDESSKSGCAREELGTLIDCARQNRTITVRGLMVIPPFELDADHTRPYFKSLRELRDRFGGPDVLPVLSMGMSHDFEVAIEEGATHVRVGTAVFGPRQR
jgi:pyridoxal phosphate enzyme (YggS family)